MEQAAAAGAAEGDAWDEPAPPAFSDGWQIGQPNRVVKPARKLPLVRGRPRRVPLLALISLDLEQDIYAGAPEFRSGNRREAHDARVLTVPMRHGPRS